MHVGNVARCLSPRTKLNFPLTDITGGTPQVQFISQELTGCPNHRRDLQDDGLRSAMSVNE